LSPPEGIIKGKEQAAMSTLMRLSRWAFVLVTGALITVHGCTSKDDLLAPYTAGNAPLSTIAVEDSVFTPRITWIGGYVSAFGVNLGSSAILDSTLVSLMTASGDGVRFPLTFGSVPPGAQDVTAQYGGTPLSRLIEDRVYTFWALKQEAWGQVSGLQHLPLVLDSSATVNVQRRNDTLYLSSKVFTTFTKRLDVYINIKDVRVYGRLCGTITVSASDTANRPIVTFRVTQSTAPDTLVSAVGICAGSDYHVDARAWEVISADVQPDTTIYWKDDVITSPFLLGQKFPGTAEFIAYPAEGLKRGVQYYLWFANKNWDQTTRTRATPNYGFATFVVW
jgi:hypothetical protein